MFEDKQNSSTLQTYSSGYRYYRQVPTNKKIERNRVTQKGEKVKVTLNQKEYYTEQDIAEFDLEEHSKLLPHMNGHKTIIHNYFIRFWGPVLDPKSGGIIAYTFIVLQSYCWDKDYTWVNLKTLCNQLTVSKPTVRKYLEILEREGFIIRFWREDATSHEQGSLLIKVRRSIPFLTKEKIDMLPEDLKIEHEKFLRKIKLESNFEFEQAYNYTKVIEDLRQKVIEVHEPLNNESEDTMKLYEIKKKSLSQTEQMYWGMVLKTIEKRLDKNVFDTWFQHTLAEIHNNGEWTIYCPSTYEKEHISKRYLNLIEEAINDLMFQCNKITVKTLT